jgi:hypothetical protein
LVATVGSDKHREKEKEKHENNERKIREKQSQPSFLEKWSNWGKGLVKTIWNRQGRSQCVLHPWLCQESDHFETPSWVNGILSPWIKRAAQIKSAQHH